MNTTSRNFTPQLAHRFADQIVASASPFALESILNYGAMLNAGLLPRSKQHLRAYRALRSVPIPELHEHLVALDGDFRSLKNFQDEIILAVCNGLGD